MLDWNNKQEFSVCPTPNDLDACNVYRNLELPEEVYQNIEHREQKAKAKE